MEGRTSGCAVTSRKDTYTLHEIPVKVVKVSQFCGQAIILRNSVSACEVRIPGGPFKQEKKPPCRLEQAVCWSWVALGKEESNYIVRHWFLITWIGS